MKGENIVKLKGYVRSPVLKRTSAYNSWFFRGKLAIPIDEEESDFQYLHIASFECAKALSEIPKNRQIYIEGRIEDSSFSIKCRHCGGYDRRFWYEIMVDNFIVLGDKYGSEK